MTALRTTFRQKHHTETAMERYTFWLRLCRIVLHTHRSWQNDSFHRSCAVIVADGESDGDRISDSLQLRFHRSSRKSIAFAAQRGDQSTERYAANGPPVGPAQPGVLERARGDRDGEAAYIKDYGLSYRVDPTAVFAQGKFTPHGECSSANFHHHARFKGGER